MANAPVADDASSFPVLVLSPSGFPPLLLAAIDQLEQLAADAAGLLAGRLDLGRRRRGHRWMATDAAAYDTEKAITSAAGGRANTSSTRLLESADGPHRAPHAPGVYR